MSIGSIIDRRTMSTGRMTLFAVHASGPLVVLIGGITAAYAASGSPGVPLGFLLVIGVLWLNSEGYAALSRRVPHAAPYYAVITRGLGRPAGVGAGFLALTAYGSIICCMYGFLGGWMAMMLGGHWWWYSLAGWAIITMLGVRPIVVSSWLLGISLAIAAIFIGLLIIAGISHPADSSVSWTGFTWHALMVGSLAPALVMCVASPLGFDAAQSFSTEAVHPEGPRRAQRAALAILGVGYAILAWAIGLANGPSKVAGLAADPSVGVPLNTMTDQYGFLMGPVTELAVVFGILATVLTVHAICARYGYAMAAERVVHRSVAHTGTGEIAGSPVGGSLLQSAIGLVAIVGFAVAGVDPILQMFSWLATVGAMGLVALLVASSLAAMRYLKREDGWWARWCAPLLGLPGGLLLLFLMVTNSAVLLGSGPGSILPIVIPSVLLLAFVGGAGWAIFLRAKHPRVYANISHNVPDWLEVPDRRLAAMKL